MTDRVFVNPTLRRFACITASIAIAITVIITICGTGTGNNIVYANETGVGATVGIGAELAGINAISTRLTVLADQDAFPQSYQINDHPAGVLYDVLRDFSNRQNIQMTFRQLPLKRALENTGNGLAGFVGINNFTPTDPFILSDGISDTSLLAITLKQRKIAITKPSDLDGLQVGLLRGLPIHGPLAHARDGRRFDVTYFSSTRQSIALLLAERIDVVLIYRGNALKTSLQQIAKLEDEEFAALEIHPEPIMNAVNQLALPANPKNARLMRHFNRYLATKRDSGALEQIIARYMNGTDNSDNIETAQSTDNVARFAAPARP
ncbi:substrate-binding periplasmic protein [Thalassospira alkalitolerans]|uniref:substrate-binding periplasmic protein n=1 Tax=Thalassospira alkalitolerans TaxID=1293890 RepID=UPI003AA7D9DC